MFKRTLRDVVSLVKVDGQRYDNIKALVQPKLIFIADASLPIEEGDRITRELPNGLVESYLVEDRGYYSAIQAMDAHYQVKVRKETAVSDEKSHPTIGTVVMGDQITVADVRQSHINIKSRLDDVAQSIGAFTDVTQPARDELEQLITELNQALQEVPSDKSEEAEKVSKRVETLIKEASAEKPDKERVEITGESLVLAAKNLATVTPIVLTIATQIVQAVSRMLP
jgi:ElaB/YqjD/DUF883 family membrane-anchored ribosome-binding protein